jgi:hypothetical protein
MGKATSSVSGSLPDAKAAEGGDAASRTCSSASVASEGTGTTSSVGAARKKLDVVAAGHASRGGDDIQAEEDAEGRPIIILKVLDENEFRVYSKLAEKYPNDPVYKFIPTYRGVLTVPDENDGEVTFIRMSNLLLGFEEPKVMDVKLGTRTFLESECRNAAPRSDLFKRMLEMYPKELTSDELQKGAITKHRWMTVRDKCSTIGRLGYRIDGVAGYRTRDRTAIDAELASLVNKDDATNFFRTFVDVAATNDGEDLLGYPLRIAEQLLALLQEMREALVNSTFVKRHEFIGSSILLIADSYGHAGVSWIDFAKTHPLAEGAELTHREPWEYGNREDGIILGFENLIEAWDHLVEKLRHEIRTSGNSVFIHSTAFSSVGLGSLAHGRRRRRFCCCGRRRRGHGHAKRAEDLALLSALPSLSHNVADHHGHVWAMGAPTHALAKVAAVGVSAVEVVEKMATHVARRVPTLRRNELDPSRVCSGDAGGGSDTLSPSRATPPAGARSEEEAAAAAAKSEANEAHGDSLSVISV